MAIPAQARRLPRERPAAAAPAPGLVEGAVASFWAAQDEQSGHARLKDAEDQALAELVEALAARGEDTEAMVRRSWRGALAPEYDADAILGAVARVKARDPKAFAGVATDAGQFRAAATAAVRGTMARTADTAARAGIVPRLAGELASGISDPENSATAAIGIGAARSTAEAVVRGALLNARTEALAQPPLAFERAARGRELTAGEAALNVGIAGAAGGLLEGVGHLAGRAIARRAATADADAAEQAIGAARMTGDERAAVTVVRREAAIDAANPDAPTGGNAERHRTALGAAMRRLLAGRAEPGPRVRVTPAPADAPPVGAARLAYKRAVRGAESGGDDAARNPRSSATGRYQFTESTWLAYHRRVIGGRMSDADRLRQRLDGDVQERLMDALTADNAAALARAGAPETGGNLYLMHFAGPAGGARLLRAAPGTPAEQVLGAEAVAANPFLKGMRAGDVVAWAHRKVGDRAGARVADAVAAPAGAPAVAAEAAGAPPRTVLDLLAQAAATEPNGRTRIEAPGLPPMEVGTVPASQVTVDAALMQFKSGGDAFGVTERLQGVTTWNPAYAGRVILWERPDGVLVVADGHQRVGLAKRIGAAEGRDIDLDAIVLRAADGVEAGQARRMAALKNIAEGTGSAIDAAKVLREAGRAALADLPPRSALVRDAEGLARLGDDAFGAVVNEVVPAEQAALIGRLLPDDPAAHAGLIKLLAKTKPANRVQAESVVRQGIAAGFVEGEQTDMFGTLDVKNSLFIERARVLDRALARLKRARGVFRTAAGNAETLEGGGNRIDVETSEARAQANAEAIELVQRLANSAGPIKDAIDRAARRLADGDKSDAVVGELVDAIQQVEAPGRAADVPDAEAVAAMRVDAPTHAETLMLWDDPDGPAAAGQAESAWHDVLAEAAPAAAARPAHTAATIVEGQRGVPLDELVARAAGNQVTLATEAERIADAVGAAWKNPGPKTRGSIERKIRDEGYADAGDIKDMARGAFVIDRPEQADALAAALAERFELFDKGWQQLRDTGFTDRKLIVRFPDGGVAEVQIVPAGVWTAKKGGLGQLYDRSRELAIGPQREALERQQREGYAAALSGSPFDGIAARSASGNAAANSSGVSRMPAPDALPTSPGASRQPEPGLNAQARSPDRATARSSTSNSSNDVMGETSDSNIGEDDAPVYRLDEEGDAGTAAELAARIAEEETLFGTVKDCL